MFESLAQIDALLVDLPAPDDRAAKGAGERQSQLVKPAGALGRLEDIAIHMAAWQGNARPSMDKTAILVFAGSHGITEHGVSAYPTEVNAQMFDGFNAGNAAICQLAKAFDADLRTFDCGIENPTADFSTSPAMTEVEFISAFQIGYSAVQGGEDLLVFGEMGIGNTTSAAAVFAALTASTGDIWVGRGTGIDDNSLRRKAGLIDQAINLHKADTLKPLQVLQHLGGREIAAIAGALLAARRHRIPVLLDGYITTAAAFALQRAASPTVLDNVIAAHCSNEQAHREALEEIGKRPLLDLGMRLGEGSGAATALGIVKAALACHNGMATFAEASVSGPG